MSSFHGCLLWLGVSSRLKRERLPAGSDSRCVVSAAFTGSDSAFSPRHYRLIYSLCAEARIAWWQTRDWRCGPTPSDPVGASRYINPRALLLTNRPPPHITGAT